MGKGETIQCEHANKALHCTKASFFGDEANFNEIRAEIDPKKCQALGRNCKDFNDDKWPPVVDTVAYEVVLQKFRSDSVLKELLLSTGSAVIGESSTNKLWGIGVEHSDAKVQQPEEWPGKNVLGRALMKARDELQK